MVVGGVYERRLPFNALEVYLLYCSGVVVIRFRSNLLSHSIHVFIFAELVCCVLWYDIMYLGPARQAAVCVRSAGLLYQSSGGMRAYAIELVKGLIFFCGNDILLGCGWSYEYMPPAQENIQTCLITNVLLGLL